MRRLALGFSLLFAVGCATDSDRPWVVQDAIASGDMTEDALKEPGPSAPLAQQAPFVESDLQSGPAEPPASSEPPLYAEESAYAVQPGAADLPDVDESNSAELMSVDFEQSELLPVEPEQAEPDTLVDDAPMPDEQQLYLADEPPLDLSAPIASLSPRPSETLVRVESLVSSAEVWTDGILLGPANEFLTLDPGRHELEIRASGFTPVYRQITLAPRAKEIIKVNLAPLAH
jgi:hypothetical protein